MNTARSICNKQRPSCQSQEKGGDRRLADKKAAGGGRHRCSKNKKDDKAYEGQMVNMENQTDEKGFQKYGGVQTLARQGSA